ncbi:hypothetical protein K491DRAFT_602487 [Lophiostoma macrostomum CBS 122681]|uniref:Membrane anchor Opy2 N-terminal domain-containing protein n=1 Tax=Lophiostoma macrostomum CBS 122681 TaxID=1314788 RepID=A0A6A6T1I3_9PLEO|nr:hypothetical protein K491DRAFT_602487 [Lophiostoma macrostomum CBS 122681]
MAVDVEHVLRTVFKRCVKCPAETPSCESIEPCAANEICVMSPPDCNSCAKVTCAANPAGSSTQASKGPNVGAIAGGVLGGVAFVAIAVFLIWKFCLKGRRRQYEEGDWQEVDMATQEKANDDFVSRRSTRASTHTVASMASSVLTRASNIIQIAYIPGVTNRSGPGSPDLLVPPVPPIPAMSPSSGFSTPYSTSEQHFFVPDFRDSMASTSTDARTSYARTSIAPSLARGSVASTVYRQNAIVSPLPAQTIVRGKAAVVSVKSSGSNSPTDTPGIETPPVPQIDPKHTVQPIRIQMPRMTSSSGNSTLSPQSSIRSTATLGPVRALNITKRKPSLESVPKRSGSTASNSTVTSPESAAPTMRPLTEISVASTDDGVAHARARKAARDADLDSDSDDDDHSRAHRSLLRASASIRDSELTEIADTPGILQSPFSDSSAVEPPRPALERHTSSSSAIRSPMTPIREESSKRASSASKRTQSPFSDDNKSDL